MKQNGVLIVCLLLLAGCYTQFERRDRTLSDQYIPPDSLMSQDSGRANIPDTLRVNNNQYCYWTRDIFGRPELRCDDSYYGRDWYRYNNNPWWSNSSSYYYGNYNSYGWDEPCPAYYYWDNTCGACRYYSSYQGHRDSWWWNSGSGSYGSSGSSSSKTTEPPRTRRSRSAGVPATSFQPSGSSTSGTTRKQSISTDNGQTTIIGETSKPESPADRTRRNRSDGVPSSSEIKNQQNTKAAAVRELNKQLEAEQRQQSPPQSSPSYTPQENVQQQSSPPPSPQQNASPPSYPSGQDNSSGDNRRERRNSRGN
jgi:hypothetical protein